MPDSHGLPIFKDRLVISIENSIGLDSGKMEVINRNGNNANIAYVNHHHSVKKKKEKITNQQKPMRCMLRIQ